MALQSDKGQERHVSLKTAGWQTKGPACLCWYRVLRNTTWTGYSHPSFSKVAQWWDLSSQVSSVQLLNCSVLQIPVLLIPAHCGTGLREKQFYMPHDSKAKEQAVAPPYPFLSPTETVPCDQKWKTVAQSTLSGSLSLTSLYRDETRKHPFWHQ